MYRPNEHERIEADFGKLIAHYLNKCYPDDRGYIKPADAFVDIEEAIDDLINIKDWG